MIYNKTKRRLSIIASILGLILSLGAIFAVALGVADLIGPDKKFLIGDSITALLPDVASSINFSKDVIRWVILVVIFLFAYLNILTCLSILKKPLCINGKFRSRGWSKLLFIIFTIICAIAVACQIFSEELCADPVDILFPAVVGAVAIVAVVLQIISMFLRSVKKEKKAKKNKKEKIEVIEVKKIEVVPEEPKVEDLVVPVEEPKHVAVFNNIVEDPVADGLDQRVREIKHLKEAGLINDEQALKAVEVILKGFIK